MFHLMFVFFTIWTTTTYTDASVSLIVDPSTIELGLTTRLSVNCTFDIESNPDVATVESIQLSRSNDSISPVYSVLCTVDTFSNTAKNSSDGKAKVLGKIDNNGVSFLTLIWNRPIETEGGNYKCDVNSLDQLGRPKTETVTGSVTIVTPGLNELIHRVQSLGLLVEDMKLVVDSYKNRQESSVKSLFIESSPFEGSRYYLSRPFPSLMSYLCQAMCEHYGGTLAEIDSQEELNFVQDFLLQFSNTFWLVLIGGTDEGHEDHWVYENTNTNKTFFAWGSYQPSGGDKENCISLDTLAYWNMTDSTCTFTDYTSRPRFLCEIHD